MTTAQIAARVAFFGSAAALAWLLYTATAVDDGTMPPPTTTTNPPSWPPNVPRPAEPSSTLPEAWTQPVARAAERVKALNPAQALTDAQAAEIARRCLWLAAADQQGFEICRRRGLPIFVSGAENPKAAEHDLEALSTPEGIGWFRLNYEDPTMKASPRRWYRNDPVCLGTTGGGTGMECDEFPFFATEQGGAFALPRPHLKPVVASQNQSQGGFLNGFYTACDMRTGTVGQPGTGAMFLIVPIPTVVPTMYLCNGKN